jgi:ELWxxDGT repeat protein
MSHTTVTHHDSPGSGAAPASSRRRLRHIGAILAGSIVVATLLLVLANLAFAQSAKKKKSPSTLKPFLVEDIYPGKTGSEPNWLVDFKGRLLFGANHPKYGEELWRSNGTRSGTSLVKDIDPGPLVVNKAQNTETGSSVPDKVLLTKNGIYFAAITAKYGEELWKSDGTAKGTTLVKDINTVPGNSNPNDKGDAINRSAEVEKLYVVGKTLYFRANDGKHGLELWKSDGTVKGTREVKDIKPGKIGSDPDSLTAFGGVLIFAADGKHGPELWGSDGTWAGTTLLRDLAPGAVGSEPGEFTTSGKFMYFAASTPSVGEELWAVQSKGISK